MLYLSSCNTGSKRDGTFRSDSMYWLQFRGPNASGIAMDKATPPVRFSADTNLLWKAEIWPGWSSPCIVNEKIFLTGFNGPDSLLSTMAIHRRTGEILWMDTITPVGFYDIHPINGYANPTVSSNGAQIFVYFPTYGLIAYDLNGNRSWCYQHDKVGEIRWGGASSPVVLDGMIILDMTTFNDPRIMALDCQTGDSLWVNRDPDHRWGSITSRATPVVWNNLIIMHHSNEIIAYNLQTGKTAWWYPTLTSAVGTPVIRDDILYVNTWSNLGEESVRGNHASFEEILMELDVNGNHTIEKEEFTDDIKIFQRPESPDAPESSMAVTETFEWFDENGDGSFIASEWNAMWDWWITNFGDHGMLALYLSGTGEKPATDLKWKVNEDTPETPSPLIVHDNVLFIKNGGIMTVIHRETGKVLYHTRIGAGGSYLASPLLAGNRIYACSFNGIVTVLSSDDFSVLRQNKIGEKIAASPVAVDDVLYLRTEKHLYAFHEESNR